jgi:hypothetical protein
MAVPVAGCRFAAFALAFALAAACLAGPAAAATVMYWQGSPELSASVVGTNEFVPGDEATLTVMVQNTGVNLYKQVHGAAIAQEELPNTAKFVRATLTSDSPLISVRTDPQQVGTIAGNGGRATLRYTLRISPDAATDEYVLPLTIDYESPVAMVQEASDTYNFVYTPASVTLPLTIRIKPAVRTEVLAVAEDTLTPGAEGYIDLTIRNAGYEDGRDAVVTMQRSGSSPVIPIDSSVYAGSFPANGTVSCRYKVAISDDAEAATYPAVVSVAYKNSEGAVVTALPVTIGVVVVAKPDLAIISSPPQVKAGSVSAITVRYRNEGVSAVYDANARITDHDPISIDDNVAYLGDLQPGEEKETTFTVAADKSAEPGEYSFDSRVRYRDSYGTSIQSDTVVMRMQILPADKGMFDNPAIIVAVLIVFIGALAVFAYWFRKGAQ